MVNPLCYSPVHTLYRSKLVDARFLYYINIAETNKYLAAKLLTIFVEFPIIFIGYGLNDEDIRLIFQDISRGLTDKHREIMSNRIIFISRAKEGIPESISHKTQRFGNHDFSFINIALHDYGILYKSLENIKPKYRVDLARKLFQEIKEIVISNNPNSKIFASALQDPNLKGSELACYIGSYDKLNMLRKAYVGISLSDLYRDIIVDNALISDSDVLLTDVLPRLQSNNPRSYFPIYKYKFHLIPEQLELLQNIGVKYIESDINEVYSKNMEKELGCKPHLGKFTSLTEIQNLANGDLIKTFKYITYSIHNLDHDQVLHYLTSIISEYEGELSFKGSSELKKLIATMDFILNK